MSFISLERKKFLKLERAYSFGRTKNERVWYFIHPIKIRTLSFFVCPIKLSHFHLWKIILNSILVYQFIYNLYHYGPLININTNLIILLRIYLTLLIMHKILSRHKNPYFFSEEVVLLVFYFVKLINFM